MTRKPSSNVAAFAAMGAALVAYSAAPASTASDVARTYQWLAAGAGAVVAVTLGVQAITTAESRPSPWPSWTGRMLWVLRPRSFVFAWAAIIGAAWLWGTPHLAIEYPPRACTYVGLTGLRHPPPNSGCPWWRWF